MEYSAKTRGRCWTATVQVQNMRNAGLTEEQIQDPEFVGSHFLDLWKNSGKGRYGAIVVCRSKDLTFHCHMGCYGNTTTLKAVSDVLFQSHVEPQYGTKEELYAYMLKKGSHAEKGEEILYKQGLDDIEDEQGKRSDLDVIEDLLNEGHTPNDIFDMSLRYRRFERMIRGQYLKLRKDATPVIKSMWNEYHFGETGTGKTYTYVRLCEEHGEDAVYLCNDYANSASSAGGLDFYNDNPAKILVLDEFCGNMPYGILVSIMDKYSRNQFHARYQNGYALWTSVYICSIYSPEMVYRSMVDKPRQQTDSMDRFMNKLNRVVYHWKDKEGHYRAFYISAKKYENEKQLRKLAEEYERTVTYEDYKMQHSKEEDDDDVVDYVEVLPDMGGEIYD